MEYNTEKKEFLKKLNDKWNMKARLKKTIKNTSLIVLGFSFLVGVSIEISNNPNFLEKINKKIYNSNKKQEVKEEIRNIKLDIIYREDILHMFKEEKKYLGIQTNKNIKRRYEKRLSVDQQKLTNYQRTEKRLNSKNIGYLRIKY